MTSHQENLKRILQDEKPALIMLAPTFPIDFSYPAIIGMLKKIGFDKVCELTFGAQIVDHLYGEYIRENPNQKYYIASPCPTVVTYIEKQFPDLVHYLVPFSSPMMATAKVCKKYYPNHSLVFVSPCYAKQNIEAPKHKNFIDEVITFRELRELFEEAGIKEEDFEKQEFQFDKFIREYTKIYPLSGALSQTAHLRSVFQSNEICVEEGVAKIGPLLEEVRSGKSQYRFFDFLNCTGGCVGGPALFNSNLNLAEKRNRVISYAEHSKKEILGKKEGKIEYADDIDFASSFAVNLQQ